MTTRKTINGFIMEILHKHVQRVSGNSGYYLGVVEVGQQPTLRLLREGEFSHREGLSILYHP